MEYFEIQGPQELHGEITPQGAKNEALQILCATLLTEEEVIIDNLPNILDVQNLRKILEMLGVEVKDLTQYKSGTDKDITPARWSFKAANLNPEIMTSREYMDMAKKIRGSVMILGPMLGRFGQAFIPKPGGDKIGRRPIDVHLDGLRQLGAVSEVDYNVYRLSSNGRLKGTFIYLDEPSVTGTANIVMAAVLAEGETTIYNAACEPYIQQLCKICRWMGAKISGYGTNRITIQGVKELRPGTGTDADVKDLKMHRCLSDMIEVGSFIGMAAMTRSKLTIKNAGVESLGIIPRVFERLGIYMETIGDDIVVHPKEVLQIETGYDGGIPTIYDHPWPGFTPDLLSVVLVVSTLCRGNVLIHQKMFESRLFFVDRLIEMGAQVILCDPHRATVFGMGDQYEITKYGKKSPLRGTTMSSPDIRAGIALLIAAMAAEGKSRIFNIQQIDRGYMKIEKRLQAVGANIVRKKEENEPSKTARPGKKTEKAKQKA